MHIRAYLFMMAAGILVPVVGFSGLALGMLQNAEKAAALRGLSESSHAIALLVDRELYSAEAALKVLAASPSLARGDLRAFHHEAITANRTSTGWSRLLDEHGQQLVNTAGPYGAKLPPPLARERVRHVLATGKTFVTDMEMGPFTGRLVTTLNLPVTLDNGKRHVLSFAFTSDHFNRLITSSRVAPGHLVGIIGNDGRFIGRSNMADQLIGKPARAELVAAARLSHDGQIRHHTLEGVESFDVFTHSALSGWTVAVAAPVEMVERSARQASMVAALGLFAAILCAAVLAAFFGRLHVRSIGRAVKAASDLGNGIPPEPMHSRVVEMNELHGALHAAGEQLRQAQSYRVHAEAEREALLEREQKARVMAEEQNTAKDQFLAMLGHELRNPLAPISTAAQLLKLQAGDANRVRYASDVIARQVAHMNSLLGDMLDVSRVTRGLVSLNLEQVELKAVIERALEQTHALVEVKHHQLALQLPEHPVWVRGDKTRLIQVFANLINNAAKYTPPHGRIAVVLATEDDTAEVTVEDNGEGIASELLPRIFDLFSQGERKPDRAQGGLGLGLALVKSLVQLHGGAVSARSDPVARGSSFTVSLPWLPAAGAAADGGSKPDQAHGAAQGLRIMIVDDNIDGAISLSLFLKEAGGHRVSTYYDGAGALEWAVFQSPEVFILDIGLPDMTGYELARRLRAMPQFAGATFIALTGYGQPQDRERAYQAGFDHHVAKPADPDQILELLNETVEK